MTPGIYIALLSVAFVAVGVCFAVAISMHRRNVRLEREQRERAATHTKPWLPRREGAPPAGQHLQ